MVEAMLEQIHTKWMARYTAQGLQWCGLVAHPPTQNGICQLCKQQEKLRQEFWRLWDKTHAV